MCLTAECKSPGKYEQQISDLRKWIINREEKSMTFWVVINQNPEGVSQNISYMFHQLAQAHGFIVNLISTICQLKHSTVQRTHTHTHIHPRKKKLMRWRCREKKCVSWSRLEVLYLIVIFASKENFGPRKCTNTQFSLFCYDCMVEEEGKNDRKCQIHAGSCASLHWLHSGSISVWQYIGFYNRSLNVNQQHSLIQKKRKYRTHAVIVYGSMRSKWLKISIMSGLLD